MAKLPKLSELTDVSSIMNKMKSAFDSLTGPSTTSATEEALSRESDPLKAKLLEVELLINQLHDLNVIQNKTISDLKTKYSEVKLIATEALEKQETVKATTAQTSEASAPHENLEAEGKPEPHKAPEKETKNENDPPSQ